MTPAKSPTLFAALSTPALSESISKTRFTTALIRSTTWTSQPTASAPLARRQFRWRADRHQRSHRRVPARNRRARHAFRSRRSPRQRISQSRRRLRVSSRRFPTRRHRANRASAQRPAQSDHVPRHPALAELERLGVARVSVGRTSHARRDVVIEEDSRRTVEHRHLRIDARSDDHLRRREQFDDQSPKLIVAKHADARNRISPLTYIQVRPIAANQGDDPSLKEFLWFRSSLAVSFPQF